ncbi:hypothetical protein C2G38_2101250 [Gigaspora rosea]|uniref:Uncharacterized protein n=1 Tax=Gigaspora rosea TaxID=44941 RepID=A0A397UQ22_9GLOM|nr:hypothetical protein C2G38_2101250 [Gigaspora rosea]
MIGYIIYRMPLCLNLSFIYYLTYLISIYRYDNDKLIFCIESFFTTVKMLIGWIISLAINVTKKIMICCIFCYNFLLTLSL